MYDSWFIQVFTGPLWVHFAQTVSTETPMDSSKSKYIFIYSFYTVNTVILVILAYYQMQS